MENNNKEHEIINDTELTPMEEIRKQVGVVDFSISEPGTLSPEMVQAKEKTEAAKLIDEIHKQAVVATVQNSDEVKTKVLKHAEKTIETELQSLEQETAKRLQTTTYDANKDACSNYGINSDVPLWQISLMKAGSSFWFVIYWIFASLVICPINVFCKGLKAFIKQSWLVIIVGIIVYLLIAVALPLFITVLAKYGFDVSKWPLF